MIVERKDNEVLVRISGSTDPSKIQSILDYIRFIELTSYPSETQEDVDQMLAESKSKRWGKVKKEIGFDDKDNS